MTYTQEFRGFPLAACPFATSEQRERLTRSKAVRWWTYQRGRALGYRRNAVTASWYARIRLRNKTFRQLRLGRVGVSSDGDIGLTFDEALSMAADWAGEHRDEAIPPLLPYQQRVLFPEVPEGPVHTVAQAVAEYAEWYRWNRRGLKNIFYAARYQIIPLLGHIPLADLTPKDLDAWMVQMVRTPPRTRGCVGEARYKPAEPDDPAYIRRRQNTANRHLELLKQALNFALRNGHVSGDIAWRVVRPYQGADQPRDVRYLSRRECRDLIAACRPDIRSLVRAALFTGCRAGDLRAMRSKHYDSERGHLSIFSQKTDHLYGHALTASGQRFFEELADGRHAEDHLFLREDDRPWTPSSYERPFKAACFAAGLPASICFHTLRHTYASHAVMNGMSLTVVARQLGLKSIKMVERYYAHLDNSFIDREVRSKMPNLA